MEGVGSLKVTSGVSTNRWTCLLYSWFKAGSNTMTSKGPVKLAIFANGSMGSIIGSNKAHGSFGTTSRACCKFPLETKAIPPLLVESCCFWTKGTGVLLLSTNGWSAWSWRSSHLLCLTDFLLDFHGSSNCHGSGETIAASDGSTLPFLQGKVLSMGASIVARQPPKRASSYFQQRYEA